MITKTACFRFWGYARTWVKVQHIRGHHRRLQICHNPTYRTSKLTRLLWVSMCHKGKDICFVAGGDETRSWYVQYIQIIRPNAPVSSTFIEYLRTYMDPVSPPPCCLGEIFSKFYSSLWVLKFQMPKIRKQPDIRPFCVRYLNGLIIECLVSQIFSGPLIKPWPK